MASKANFVKHWCFYTFFLNNKQGTEDLKVTFNDVKIKHNFKLKYLGITIDHTLTFSERMEKLNMEIKSRIIILQQLDWSVNAMTLKTALMAWVSVG